MKSIHLLALLAAIFILLGGWALLFPAMVENLVLKPEYYAGTATSKLLMGCFGAQAVLTGVALSFARFRPIGFLVFGCIGSIPFFLFNYYFYFELGMFTEWMLVDFVGNIGILALCVMGYILRKKELSRQYR